VAYSNSYEDDEIIRIATAENRVVLTRDTELAARRSTVRAVLIKSDDYLQQIDQVIREFGLTKFDVFSRCLECNIALRGVSKESVFDRVPPYVYLTQERFALCPSCNRSGMATCRSNAQAHQELNYGIPDSPFPSERKSAMTSFVLPP
jgi:uncharacterized protein with PIN domain